MQTNRVRRVPVVNEEKKLVGIVSLDDLARAVRNKGREQPQVTEKEVAQTFAGICCR